MANKTFNFYKNWNKKLDCDFYSTVRLDKPYYQVGESYAVFLNKVYQHEVKIIAKKSFWLKNVNEFMSYTDAAVSPSEFQELISKMYPKENFNSIKMVFILVKKAI